MTKEAATNASDEQEQPLDLFAKRAKRILVISAICTALFAMFASQATAELTSASSIVAAYDSSDTYYYEYGSSELSAYRDAVRSRQTNEALAPFCLFVAYASAAAAGVSALALVGANLLIAYKKSEYR